MSEAPNQQPQSEVFQRADVMVDQLGERLGRLFAQAGQQARKTAARAREEAEDIWAEAQQIRHGEHPTKPQ